MIESLARFIHEHLDSSFEELGAHRGGTRTTEAQAVFESLIKAAGSDELRQERMMMEASRRLGVRYATFKHLCECRVKMDRELEDGVEMGSLLKVLRKKRKDACDDDAELFDDWSHNPLICRYDLATTRRRPRAARRYGAKTRWAARLRSRSTSAARCRAHAR